MSDSIPSLGDFLEDHGCLDAHEAWKNFGGLTLNEAYEKLWSRPEIYLGDFAHMGERAFAHYFEVLERFVRNVIKAKDEEGYEQLSPIRDVIWFHFAQPFDEEVHKQRVRARDQADGGRLRRSVVELCDYVLTELLNLLVGAAPYSTATEEGITIVWRGLREVAAEPV